MLNAAAMDSIRNYRLTTVRSSLGRFRGLDYGVRMLGQPRVGRPMVMYGDDGNERIVTSPVIRMFNEQAEGGTYVETKNTLYLLETAH